MASPQIQASFTQARSGNSEVGALLITVPLDDTPPQTGDIRSRDARGVIFQTISTEAGRPLPLLGVRSSNKGSRRAATLYFEFGTDFGPKVRLSDAFTERLQTLSGLLKYHSEIMLRDGARLEDLGNSLRTHQPTHPLVLRTTVARINSHYRLYWVPESFLTMQTIAAHFSMWGMDRLSSSGKGALLRISHEDFGGPTKAQLIGLIHELANSTTAVPGTGARAREAQRINFSPLATEFLILVMSSIPVHGSTPDFKEYMIAMNQLQPTTARSLAAKTLAEEGFTLVQLEEIHKNNNNRRHGMTR